MLVRSYNIFVHKKKYNRLFKRVFFYDTMLELMDEMSEANEDNIDALFEALLLDWETTPAPASPIIPAHPSFAHTTLQDVDHT